MYIYLPIAEISVNILYIVLVGFLSGCISGFFGISGSFIGVPILVTYGIDSSAAVSGFTNQMLTMSFINTKEDLKEKKINFNVVKFGFPGTISGVLIGIFLFKKLSANGYIDLVVSFLYIFVLGSISSFMMNESWGIFREKYFSKNSNFVTLLKREKKDSLQKTKEKKKFIEKIDIFPYKILLAGDVKISIFLINFFGFFAGMLVAVAGVASGLIMIPVMIYIYKMHIRHAMATSNFNGGLIVFFSNILQILTVKKTDFILSFLLLFGAIIGILISRKFSNKLSPEILRFGLASLMAFIVLRMVLNISLTPKDIFFITSLR